MFLNNIRPHVETLDNHSSLVSVEGADFNALGNFILNNKAFVSKDGTFAGIPPTLLAPTQFLGATMQVLKVRSCSASRNNISSILLGEEDSSEGNKCEGKIGRQASCGFQWPDHAPQPTNAQSDF